MSDRAGRFTGRVALVTGAARGQGRSHALRLASEGADVILVDIAGPVGDTARYYPPATGADLDATAADIARLGRRAVTIVCDVRDFSPLSSGINGAVEQLGALTSSSPTRACWPSAALSMRSKSRSGTRSSTRI